MIALAAFAALSSCKKDTVQPEPAKQELANTATKTVKIKLNINGSKTYAESAPASTKTPALNDVTLYMVATTVNPDAIVKIVAGVPADLTGAGQTITNVPGSVDKIYAVANSAVTLQKIKANPATLTELATELVDVNVQKDPLTAVNLLGNGAVTANATTPGQMDAMVDLYPATARIEIGKIAGKTDITKFDLEGIFVTNTFLHKSVVNEVFPTTNAVAKTAKEATANGVVNYDPSNTAVFASKAAFGFDQLADDITGATGKLEYTPATAGQVWGYQVLAGSKDVAQAWTPATMPTVTNGVNAASGVPVIVVKLNNVETTQGTTPTGTEYLNIAKFIDDKNQPITHFEEGMVYSIEKIEFDESNLASKPATPSATLIAKVTVHPWTEAKTTIQF